MLRSVKWVDKTVVRRTQKSFDLPVLLVFVEVESSVVVPVAVLKVGERFAAAEFLPEKKFNQLALFYGLQSNLSLIRLQTCQMSPNWRTPVTL